MQMAHRLGAKTNTILSIIIQWNDQQNGIQELFIQNNEIEVCQIWKANTLFGWACKIKQIDGAPFLYYGLLRTSCTTREILYVVTLINEVNIFLQI